MLSRSVTRFSPRLLAASLATCLLSICITATSSEQWPSTGVHSPSYVRIRNALIEETQLEFIDTPLHEVVAFLSDQHDIPIELDAAAMDDIGVGSDTPTTRTLTGISLGSALKLLLNQLGMTYTIENGVLMLTTEDAAARRPEIRIYNVGRLLGDDRDATNLASTVIQVLHPGDTIGVQDTSVQGAGGFFAVQDQPGQQGTFPGNASGTIVTPTAAGPTPGMRIIPFRQLLIVRHTTVGQEQVAAFLADLAAALDEAASQRPTRSKAPQNDPFGPAAQEDPFGGPSKNPTGAGGEGGDPFS